MGCEKMVSYGNGYHLAKCNRPVKSADGKYCGIHDPQAKKAREAKRGPSKFERELEAMRRRARQLNALRDEIMATRRWTDGKPAKSDSVWWGGDEWGAMMNARKETDESGALG